MFPPQRNSHPVYLCLYFFSLWDLIRFDMLFFTYPVTLLAPLSSICAWVSKVLPDNILALYSVGVLPVLLQVKGKFLVPTLSPFIRKRTLGEDTEAIYIVCVCKVEEGRKYYWSMMPYIPTFGDKRVWWALEDLLRPLRHKVQTHW